MNEKILKRKKRNRKLLLYIFLFSIVAFFTQGYWEKISELREAKKEVINSEMFSVDNSFLNREEFFYRDEDYLKKHAFLKKEWEAEYEGVKFYGKSESKEQKYSLASTNESPKTSAVN